MDSRVRTFEADAAEAFRFLDDLGFNRSSSMGDSARRPFTLTVMFRHPSAQVEARLALGFAGEDSVNTVVRTLGGVRELTPHVAHTGREVRKALALQAGEVRQLIGPAA